MFSSTQNLKNLVHSKGEMRMTEAELWREYSERKKAFIEANPNATQEEILTFCKALAEKLGL